MLLSKKIILSKPTKFRFKSGNHQCFMQLLQIRWIYKTNGRSLCDIVAHDICVVILKTCMYSSPVRLEV